jgi:hypothetical protein
MAVEMRIDLKNSQEFIDVLHRFPSDIDKSIAEALGVVMDNILKRAKQNAPVDTGRLRADIQAKVLDKELSGIIWNEVEYAIHVHAGHRTKSQYILRAIKNNQKAIEERIKAKMELLAKRGLK